MIFDALDAILKADPAVAAPITAAGVTRIWHMSAPPNRDYPDIVIYAVTGTMHSSLEGTTPPWTRRLSAETRAQTYKQAHELGDKVIAALNNYVGTIAGEQIHACHLVGDVPDVDETSAIKRRIIDFRVMHSPAT